MVKIDAEELRPQVLRGAGTLLDRTELFLAEAAVACSFENTVASTLQFMAEHGYQLIDISELNRSPQHNLLWLTELAFLRNATRLLSHATSYE